MPLTKTVSEEDLAELEAHEEFMKELDAQLPDKPAWVAVGFAG